MTQRLSHVSVLSGSVIIAALLLNACSTWGSNPPPRFNQVIGDRRAPVLNPGGTGNVRPADEIAPPAGVYIAPANGQANAATPAQQNMVPTSAPTVRFDPEITPGAAPTAASPFSNYAAPVQSAPAQTTPSTAYPSNSPFGVSSERSSYTAPMAQPQNYAFAPAASLAQAAPAAGGNPPSIAVAQAPSIVADISTLGSGEGSNTTSAAWQNIPGGNPLTPALTDEEKAQANAASLLSSFAPAAGGNAAHAATPSLASIPNAAALTPAQIEAARLVMGQLAAEANQKKAQQQALNNDAKNLFSEAKSEEKQDAILAASRDTRNPINQTDRPSSTAFTYSATPMSGTLDMQLPAPDAATAPVITTAQPAMTLFEAPANVPLAPALETPATLAPETSEVEIAAEGTLTPPRAPEASESYLPESRYTRYRGNFHSYRLSKLSLASQN